MSGRIPLNVEGLNAAAQAWTHASVVPAVPDEDRLRAAIHAYLDQRLPDPPRIPREVVAEKLGDVPIPGERTTDHPERCIRLRRLEMGGYGPLDYDRELVLDGLTWRRVRGGLGGRGDREDWVLDVPEAQGVVTRWPLSQDRWEHGRFASCEEAMRCVVARRPAWIETLIAKQEPYLAELYGARRRLAGVSRNMSVSSSGDVGG